MDNEAVSLLISKLDKSRLARILKRCVAENRRFRIDGFTNMEKVTPVILGRQLSKNDKMTADFLLSTIKEFVEDPSNLKGKTVDEIKISTNVNNRLGIVAHCLLQAEDEFAAYAKHLLNEYIVEDKPNENVHPLVDTDAIEREKKKTEKYRQRYLEQKKELEEFQQEVKKLRIRIAELSANCAQKDAQIERDASSIAAIQSRVSEMQQEINSLKEKNELLLGKNRSSRKESNRKVTRRLAMRVLAVGCYDALSKFNDVVDIYPSQVSDLINKENDLSKYDEVWVVSIGIPFSGARLIKKMQARVGEKIQMFSSYQELVEYANDICNRG